MIYELWNEDNTELENTITNPDSLKLSKMSDYVLVVEDQNGFNHNFHDLTEKQNTFTATERQELWVYTVKPANEIREYLNTENYNRCRDLKANIRQQALNKYDQIEIDEWVEYRTRAEADDTTFFTPVVANCSMTETDFIAAVLSHSNILRPELDSLTAIRNHHKEDIAATADADLINYDVSLYWPDPVDLTGILFAIG